MRRRTWSKWGLIGLVALLVAIQAVPYGRAHVNPPVVAEPHWDSPTTRALAVRACFDCHSNETVWPWFTSVAPISWLAERHVEEGRRKLNFSEWTSGGNEVGEMVETIREGEMPPVYFGWMHASARLSDSETQQLIQGLQATFGTG
ncbi:hypothetical protein BMS3Abin02_00446 [bacterium BMS3Abin02]|nr:hypothetical protein BMS3Abin02_00446 [bacterium BMS3Abin02]